MFPATLRLTGSIAGVGVDAALTRTASGIVPGQSVSLAAGKAGSLSTRTDDNDGVLTLAADHGITDGKVISIFWTAADGRPAFAYRAIVGTVSGASVPFTGAAGTALPAASTAIVASVEIELDVDFDRDSLVVFEAHSDQIVGMNFETAVDASVGSAVRAAGEPLVYVAGAGFTLPITGDPVDALRLANGSTVASSFRMAGLYDSET